MEQEFELIEILIVESGSTEAGRTWRSVVGDHRAIYRVELQFAYTFLLTVCRVQGDFLQSLFLLKKGLFIVCA